MAAVFWPPRYNFPPVGPVTMTQVIPSYPYQEYDDDDTIWAFFDSYNQTGQNYVDTVNDLNLPIYTDDNIYGPLLDWVGQGIYGYPRPALSNQVTKGSGELNTWELNTTELNRSKPTTTGTAALVDDDTYKRCLTWHLFKGDGKYFNIRWLKRRIMRFLIGVNGSHPPIDQTYQISVTFGTNNEVTIRFIDFTVKVISGAQLNRFMLNTTMLNVTKTVITPLTPLPFREIFQEAVNEGVLELPFQFSWVVVI